jgi:arylsulfatase
MSDDMGFSDIGSYGGEIRTPNLVSRSNKFVDDPGHVIDLMATCVDLSGAKYPAERDGQKIHPMEGVSLRPVLTGKALKRARPIFWEHEGNRAVRDGRWKLVARENQPWELYDIKGDRTEMINLATKYDKKVKELSARWDAWASRAQVLPAGAWRAPAR